MSWYLKVNNVVEPLVTVCDDEERIGNGAVTVNWRKQKKYFIFVC